MPSKDNLTVPTWIGLKAAGLAHSQKIQCPVPSCSEKFNMVSIALIVTLLWSTCYATPATVSSTLFRYETEHLTEDQSFPFPSANANPVKNGTCKVFPGDAAWPSLQTWARFNQTLNGSLIQTVPLAASCYPDWSGYNPERCDAITASWNKSSLQYYSIPYSAS